MTSLKTLKPRVWWVRPQHFTLPYGACVDEPTVGGIKVHDSAYVELLERIVERQGEALTAISVSKNLKVGEKDGPPTWEANQAINATTAVQQMCEEFKGG